jgi:hypothetical protein
MRIGSVPRPARPRGLAPSAPALAALLAALVAAIAAPPAGALIPRVAALPPPGWTATVVPRTAPDVTDSLVVTVPEQLRTDQPTWLNWTSRGNAAAGGGWTDALYLDGALIAIVGRPFDPVWAERHFYTLNDGPVWVGGGRHTLTEHADLYGMYIDGPSSQIDDYAACHYLWPPTPTAWGAARGGTSPPSRVGVHYYPVIDDNCAAYALDRPALFPWVIAVTGPARPRLVLYDDYVNSTTGLSHVGGQVSPRGDTLDLLVGSGGQPAATVYPGIQRDEADTPGAYVLSSSDASGRIGTADSEWPSVNLPAQTVAHVYRVTLTAGQPVPISLTRFMGSADLAFAVFSPGGDVVSTLGGALARSSPHQGGEYDVLMFEPPVTGDYALVVHRVTRAGIEAASGYALALGSHAVEVARGGRPALALAVASAQPAAGPVRLVMDLPSDGAVRLDVFDAQGRRSRALDSVVRPAGRHEVTWDGRDDTGAASGPGVYWARLEHGGRALARRIVRLR